LLEGLGLKIIIVNKERTWKLRKKNDIFLACGIYIKSEKSHVMLELVPMSHDFSHASSHLCLSVKFSLIFLHSQFPCFGSRQLYFIS
jgi:hypothetical protein